jgi:hypothetical protein
MAAVAYDNKHQVKTWPIQPRLKQERVLHQSSVDRRGPQRVSASSYRRRRLGAAILATSVLLVVGLVLGRLGAGPLASSEASRSGLIASQTYVVKSGDTDWSIAKALHPSGDIRQMVDYLAHQHDGAPLQVGEVLQLP